MRFTLFESTALAFAASAFHVIEAVPFFSNRLQTATGSLPASAASSGFSMYSTPSLTPYNATINKKAPYHNSSSLVPQPHQPSQSPKPSQPALVPTVHWDADTKNLQNLAPTISQDLYYSSNGVSDQSIEHVFALISTNISNPSVVLEHSAFIESVRNSSNGLHIIFNNLNALAYAESAWSSAVPLVLITFAAGVGSSTQQRTFWLVSHIEVKKSDNSINAVIQHELSIEEAMPEVQIVWGTYKPSGAATASGSTKPLYPLNGTSAYDGSANLTSSTSGSFTNRTSMYGISANLTTPTPGNFTNSTSTYGISANLTTPTPGNFTDSTCGAPPSLKIDGFYTAACGSPTFDQDIDNQIGYLDFDEADYSASLQDFAPGLSDDGEDYSPSDNPDFGPTKVRRSTQLQRRGIFSAIGKAFSKAVKFVANAGQAVLNGAVKVANAVSDFLALTPNASADIPINIGPKKLVTSPWGPALQLLNKDTTSKSGAATAHLALYCVDCGITGAVHLNGMARFTILHGIEQFNAGLNGNLAAGLQLGIDASGQLQQTFPFPIASTAVPPGFSVPGIFSIGPIISLKAEVELDVSLAGQVLAGIKMTIPNFSANLDLVDGSKSFSKGFTPQFEKVFQANAAVSASAALGLPLGIGLGLEIPPIKFSKTAAIYDKPSISATINYVGGTAAQGTDPSPSCFNGINYNLDFHNDIYVDLFGVQKFDLFNYTAPIAGDCIALGAAAAPTTVASAGDIASADTPVANATTQNTTAPERRAIANVLTKRDGNNDTDFAYVEDSDEDSSADDSDFETLSDEALAEASDETQPTPGDIGVADDPDSSFVYITDLSNTYMLGADADTGSLLIGSPGEGSLFAATDTYVVGDDAGRYLHYYPDLMNVYGVSRFRLSNESFIPKDADFVSLVPVNYNNDTSTPDVYAAFDTSNNVFLTITCDIAGEFSKVFLAMDVESGIQTLQDPKLRYTITGGIVTSCYYLPWAAPSIVS